MDMVYFVKVLCPETGATEAVWVPPQGGTVLPAGAYPGDGVCGAPEFSAADVRALERGDVLAHKGHRYYKR
jgi:hypothetical protein